MSGPKVVVYAGPTISPAEVDAIVPGAQVRAPVARGDLLAGRWQRGDTVVVVDGYFRERRSVGHKEILWLIGEGVEVIGAASMGALRAAELAPCGMRGVGDVYRMLASGEIDGDDEVAVLHGPAEMGYPAQTVAMVNLRFGCREGERANLIPAGTAQRILLAVKDLPFMHRTWDDLRALLEPQDRVALATLEQRIGSGEWNVKRMDAVAALQSVAARDTPKPTSP